MRTGLTMIAARPGCNLRFEGREEGGLDFRALRCRVAAPLLGVLSSGSCERASVDAGDRRPFDDVEPILFVGRANQSRPNEDIGNGWTVEGTNAAWDALNDAINQPTVPAVEDAWPIGVDRQRGPRGFLVLRSPGLIVNSSTSHHP